MGSQNIGRDIILGHKGLLVHYDGRRLAEGGVRKKGHMQVTFRS